MFKKKLNGFIFVAPSKYKTKKYDVYSDGKYLLSFGGIKKNGEPYQQYKDKIGFYKKYNHLDEKRKEQYFKRHGKLIFDLTPDFFSKYYLW